MREKIAVPLEGHSSVVLLNNGERMSRKAAKQAGYLIHGEAAPAPEIDTLMQAHQSWCTSILCLPEARERIVAATELVNHYTAVTMPVASARAFLRGLPTEHIETKDPPIMTTDNDPRATRLAEIRSSMNGYNLSRGYAAKDGAPKAIGLALDGIDPVRLKRLAEIRLNALDAQTNNAPTKERKALRYAMLVHSQTAVPLATVFKQMGVDTSKMLGK